VVAAASFFAWAVLRRLVSGRERLVLFEHAWLAGACVAGYAAAIGQPVWRWLDVFAVALCLFLAVGRLGCLVAGCCHGLPSALGVVYGGEGQDPHPYAGLRLFPVQAVESAVLGATGVIGLLALPGADDGDVLLGLMVTYAIARFGTEALRGDRRPRILGIPVARAAAVVQLAAALVLSELRHGAPPGVGPRFGVVAAGLVVVTVSWAGGTAGRRAWARGSGRR
jgi:hypothetical protein